MSNNEHELIKSGFVAIIGKPNVGKSTLLNVLVNKQISIVTNKPQTTRNQIKGIYNKKNVQIIFIDTPGIHKNRTLLGKYMNKSAFQSLKGVDLILFVAPVNDIIYDDDLFILNQIEKAKIKCFLVLSKIDRVNEEKFIIQKKIAWSEKYNFDQIIPISAKENINIDKLIMNIENILPDNVRYFPKEQFTDCSEQFLIQEIIRGNILKITNQEVPYSTSVLVEKIIEKSNIKKIFASIIVERKSQKLIMVGKNGHNIKRIGILSRAQIEQLFSSKVYLDLFVKVEDEWRQDEKQLKKLGYN